MNKRSMAIAAVAATAISAQATMKTELLVNFIGSIEGNTYTLGAGEIDTTGTFVGFGNPSVAAGEADLIGGGTHQGFEIDPGTIIGDHWVAESLVSFDSFGIGQLSIISVQGGANIRINNEGTDLEMKYWDGETGEAVFAGGLPSTGTELHLAMVWDATATSLTAYIDGTSIGTVDNNAYFTSDASSLSFGYYGRSGFDNRGIDGQFSSVSFSTSDVAITTADFVIPEPATFGMVAVFGGGLLFVRRKLMM